MACRRLSHLICGLTFVYSNYIVTYMRKLVSAKKSYIHGEVGENIRFDVKRIFPVERRTKKLTTAFSPL